MIQSGFYLPLVSLLRVSCRVITSFFNETQVSQDSVELLILANSNLSVLLLSSRKSRYSLRSKFYFVILSFSPNQLSTNFKQLLVRWNNHLIITFLVECFQENFIFFVWRRLFYGSPQGDSTSFLKALSFLSKIQLDVFSSLHLLIDKVPHLMLNPLKIIQLLSIFFWRKPWELFDRSLMRLVTILQYLS